MESYILKNVESDKSILLYQEKKGYTFSPKNGCYRVKKITVLNDSMVECILKDKVITFTEIDRLKNILLNKYYKYLKKEFVENYIRKLQILETELKKIHVMELQSEIEEQEERGMSR